MTPAPLMSDFGLRTARTCPVLVVEDLDEDYDTVLEAAHRAAILNPLDRRVTLSDARAALGTMDEDPYGFVLLDLNLPDGSGADFIRALRADARHRTLPVVVFSTSDNPSEVRRLYAAGANAYHVKTLRHQDNLDALVGIFGYWLGQVCLFSPGAR